MNTRSLTTTIATVAFIMTTLTAYAQTAGSGGTQPSQGTVVQPLQGTVVQPGPTAIPNQPMSGGALQPPMSGGGMTGMQPSMQQGGMQGMQPPMSGGGMMPMQGIGPAAGPQGACVMKISEDRTSVSLTDQTGQQVSHVALGQDRIQKIFKAPDGSWSVVVYKVRRVNQFGGIAINLAGCDPQEAREFRAVPEAVEFQGEEMAVRYQGGSEERYPLVNKTLP